MDREGRGELERRGGRGGRGREGTHINKQVLPQAPSPTMTSLRRISAMAALLLLLLLLLAETAFKVRE